MIEARGITKFFSIVNPDRTAEGLTAVHSVSLSIPKGKIVSLVGPSGCGKSTFLEILAGLQAPSDGQVYINGKLVLEPLPASRDEIEAYRKKYRFLSPISNSLVKDRSRHDIAMIFQDYAVFPWMTALENVTFTLRMRGVSVSEREYLARQYLRGVGLEASRNKYPSQLSGGMRQRLALARAISFEPEIILMDEPFAAVDTQSREDLQDDLLKIWSLTGKTIVLVTHDLDEAVYLSDEIIVFSRAPGSIRNTIPVALPRPRIRTDPKLIEIKKRIQLIYKFDVEHESDCWL